MLVKMKKHSSLPIVFSLTLLAVSWGSCKLEKVSYTGYTLYRSTPQTHYQVNKLRQLMEERRDRGIQFWTEPNMINRTVDMMVSPEEQDELRELLRSIRVPTKTIMHDVGEVIKRTTSVHPSHRKTNRFFDNSTINRELEETLSADIFFTRYARYTTIESKLKQLALDPRVTLERKGKTFEGRNLYLVKVSSNPAANKPIIFLDAGHHAREWISHATLLYIMESLVNPEMGKPNARKPRARYSAPEEDTNVVEEKQLVVSLRSHLEHYDFWFVPVVNPDGYEYSHTHDRNWRKTRSVHSMNYCVGADPNRNYPHHWGQSGVSRFTCSDIYPGPNALSEPEVALVSQILTENKERIKMYITLHAYSQLILLPYGYDRVKPDNYNELMQVADAGANAIEGIRGTQYKAGTSSIMLYPAAGGSDDFAHGTCNIKQSFTIELPDTGHHGFLLPANEIIPVGQETVNGISAMIGAMRRL